MKYLERGGVLKMHYCILSFYIIVAVSKAGRIIVESKFLVKWGKGEIRDFERAGKETAVE